MQGHASILRNLGSQTLRLLHDQLDGFLRQGPRSHHKQLLVKLSHPLDCIQAVKDLLPVLRLEVLDTLFELLFSISQWFLRGVVMSSSLCTSRTQCRVLLGLGLYLPFLSDIPALFRSLEVVPHHTGLTELHVGVHGGRSLL